MSLKLQNKSLEAQSSLGLGRAGGEKEAGRKAAPCSCSSDCGIYCMHYSLFLSLREKTADFKAVLRNLRFCERMAYRLGSPEAELTQRFLGSGFEGLLSREGEGQHREGETAQPGRGHRWRLAGAQPCGGDPLELHLQHTLVSPGGQEVSFCVPTSESLAEGCGEMVAGPGHLTGRWRHGEPGQLKKQLVFCIPS